MIDVTSKEATAQKMLITHGLLDPPADGAWGPQSRGALSAFQKIHGLTDTQGLLTAKALEQLESIAPPVLDLKDDLASKIVRYMKSKNYHVSLGPDRYNIVYLEGVSTDGTLNEDKPNEWNDLRMLIHVPADKPVVKAQWAATTEPGRKYTVTPVSPDGAFRIAFGQYKSWAVGIHKNDHEALVQVADIKGHRDKNKDYQRAGDKLITASMNIGINQHWGYDLANVDDGSAGCLVGQKKQEHRDFMKLVKSDPRYQVAHNYRFFTTVIYGRDILS